MSTDETPAVEMKMQPQDLTNLREQVASVKQQDFHLGRVLEALVLHLAHAHGLDPAMEDAKAKAETRRSEQAAEDERLAAEAERLSAKRAAEDAQPRTPEEQAALEQARAAEDERIAADAKALAEKRAAESEAMPPAPETAFAPPVESEAHDAN